MQLLTSVLPLLAAYGSIARAAVFEELTGGLPQGWEFSRTPKADQPLKLRIALKQQNVEAFEQKLLDMSTPDHASYGQHMTHLEVRAMLKPTKETTDASVSWLQDSNVTSIDEDSDWINFVTTVEKANSLLDTEFLWYRNEERGLEVLRTLQYSVPESVAEYINLIQPTTRFPNMRRHGKRDVDSAIVPEVPDVSTLFTSTAASSGVDPACNTTITPQCLLQLYNIHYGANAKGGSKLAFASFLEEYARYSDLNLFAANIAPYLTGRTFDVVSFNGGLNDQTSPSDSGEANLDNQYEFGVGHPLPITEYTTGGRGPLVPDLDQPDPNDNSNEPYLEYFTALSKLPNSQIPQVISHSYGEDEQSVPASYAKQVCNMIAQLGARGITVIFSSGDSGVGSACLTNDGTNRTVFQPQFPAACPFVTSVGSTRYIDEQGTVFSSGGFSRIWSRPLYQELAVQGYLYQLGNKFSQYYNRNGRGFPDVATQGYRYSVYDKGVLKRYQGTSCSAPVFASVVSLLNAARIARGLPTLGFLNPWLYTAGVFGINDITKGGSTGCNGRARFNGPPNGSPVIPYASFNCTKGWDPVTGLGTPDFGKLLAIAAPGTKNAGGPLPA